jgi:hypothetical protein
MSQRENSATPSWQERDDEFPDFVTVVSDDSDDYLDSTVTVMADDEFSASPHIFIC